jgi:hypothetical protein
MNAVALKFSGHDIEIAKMRFRELYAMNQDYLAITPAADWGPNIETQEANRGWYDVQHFCPYFQCTSFFLSALTRCDLGANLGGVSEYILPQIPIGGYLHMADVIFTVQDQAFAVYGISTVSYDGGEDNVRFIFTTRPEAKAAAVTALMGAIQANPLYQEFANYSSMLAQRMN